MKLREKRKPPDGGKGGSKLKKLITLHAIAAAATTIAYTIMTHGDWAYILAMMALYNWVLGTAAIVADIYSNKNAPTAGKQDRDTANNKSRSL